MPKYVMPKMDGIGANEYIVAVTQDAVDFYSAGDTPAPWELNMWYHTLNCGFRPRLSGETDFPCIYDERVGMARTYFKADSAVGYERYIDALRAGRSYVSEGGSHIINFAINGLEAGTYNSELKLARAGEVKVKAQVAAFLPEQQDEDGALIASRPLDRQPFWNIERARIPGRRKVKVELVVNGAPVDTADIVANGKWQDISFSYSMKQSGWLALRIYPSSHTNPVFVIVDNKPVRVRKSAEWCLQAVNQCWQMKRGSIRAAERGGAEAAYNEARRVYERIVKESDQ